MNRGWQARGLLQPLWRTYPGGRDALAEAVGTKPPTLSAVNTGRRNLGWDLGRRLADELGVNLLELGAPSESEEGSRDLYALLERVAEDVAALRSDVAELRVRIDAIDDWIRTSAQRKRPRVPVEAARLPGIGDGE